MKQLEEPSFSLLTPERRMELAARYEKDARAWFKAAVFYRRNGSVVMAERAHFNGNQFYKYAKKLKDGSKDMTIA